MKRLAWLVSAFVLIGCATTYQPKGITGGFEETKLADRTFQVRIEANAYTTSSQVSQFLLRRCAELTLERGFRYFSIESSEETSRTTMGYSFPEGRAVIKLREPGEDVKLLIDAVVVIDETDEIARGRLSPDARRALTKLEGE